MKLSVIMPMFNICAHKELFYEAIKSIVDQSFVDFELLMCFDGGAAKGDKMLVLKYLNDINDYRIKLFNFAYGKPLGPAIVRNLLFNQSRGEFVTFHDSDDASNCLRFEKLLDGIKDEPVIASNVFVNFLENPDKSRKKGFSGENLQILLSDKKVKPAVHMCSAIMRSNFFRSFGGFEKYQYSSDSIFAVKLGYYYSLVYGKSIKVLDDSLYTWNRYSRSITMNLHSIYRLHKCQKVQRKEILKSFWPEIKERFLVGEVKEEELRKHLGLKDNLSDMTVGLVRMK